MWPQTNWWWREGSGVVRTERFGPRPAAAQAEIIGGGAEGGPGDPPHVSRSYPHTEAIHYEALALLVGASALALAPFPVRAQQARVQSAASTRAASSYVTFGMAGMAAGQTARVNALNLAAGGPLIAGGSCQVTVTFLDESGKTLATQTLSRRRGSVRRTSIYRRSQADAGADPVEIRATVSAVFSVSATATTASAGFCSIVPTMEIFEQSNGATMAHLETTHALPGCAAGGIVRRLAVGATRAARGGWNSEVRRSMRKRTFRPAGFPRPGSRGSCRDSTAWAAAAVMQRTASSTEAPACRRKIQGTLADVRARSEEIAISGTKVLTAICSARCAELRSVAIEPDYEPDRRPVSPVRRPPCPRERRMRLPQCGNRPGEGRMPVPPRPVRTGRSSVRGPCAGQSGPANPTPPSPTTA